MNRREVERTYDFVRIAGVVILLYLVINFGIIPLFGGLPGGAIAEVLQYMAIALVALYTLDLIRDAF